MAKFVFLQDIGYPFLGPMSLAGVLRRHGHEVDALIGSKAEDFLPILTRETPQVVAFSTMTGGHHWALEIARAVKKQLPQVKTIMGGPHPTFTPDVILKDGLDIICRGEGDEAIARLANAIQANESYDQIPNLWVKKDNGEIIRNELGPLVADLDSLPNPWRDLYHRYPAVAYGHTQVFMAGRGCPFDCTFCFDHQLKEMYRGKGKFVRYRTPRSIVDEVKEVTAKIPTRSVYFNDDTLILNRKWVLEFAKLYGQEVGLPFTCLIRADLADEETIRSLAAANCRSVFFGIETGNETLRNGVLRKKVTNEQIAQTAKWLKQNRIRFRAYNILGLPGETLQDAFETVAINIRIRTDYPWASIFMPYPGTELAEVGKQMGILDPAFSSDDVLGTFHASSPLRIPHAREVENLHKLFQTAVLMPWTFPLIKRLVHLPPNPLFRLWFTIVYGYVYVRSENRGWWETLVFGLKNLKHLAPKVRVHHDEPEQAVVQGK